MRRAVFAAALLLAAAMTGCSAAGQTVQTGYIGEEEAKSTALGASGVTEDQVSFQRTELETDDGKAYYEIEFRDGAGVSYQYDIDAMTGAVIAYETDADDGTIRTAEAADGEAGALDEAAAKQIALDDAGLSADAVTFVRAERERDDGVLRYEVEFYDKATGTEYDYEIDAATGTIISLDANAERYAAPGTDGLVSEESVRKTVLARVPGAADSDLRMHLEHDDGREQYEGTIVYDGMEYEFEADAYSGAIRSWEAELVFD